MNDANVPSHVLRAVGRLIGAEPTALSVKATYLGREFEFSYTSLDGDDHSTSIEVEIPLDCPLVVQLSHTRSSAPEDEAAALHGMIFGVAAPMDVAKRLFDRPLCESLCAIGRMFKLSTIARRPRRYISWGDAPLLDQISSEAREQWRDRKLLALSIPGWIEDTANALRAVEVMMSVARRLPEAQTGADAALAIGHDGAPYRGVAKNPQSLIAARERETARAMRAIAKQDKHSVSLLLVMIPLAPFLLVSLVIDWTVGLVRRLSR